MVHEAAHHGAVQEAPMAKLSKAKKADLIKLRDALDELLTDMERMKEDVAAAKLLVIAALATSDT